MPVIEIETTHPDWIFDSEVGQHIDRAIRRDDRVNGGSLGEREIAQNILRAGGISKQTERGSVRADQVADVREHSVHHTKIPVISRQHSVAWWRQAHATAIIRMEIGELTHVEFRNQNDPSMAHALARHGVAKACCRPVHSMHRNDDWCIANAGRWTGIEDPDRALYLGATVRVQEEADPIAKQILVHRWCPGQFPTPTDRANRARTVLPAAPGSRRSAPGVPA